MKKYYKDYKLVKKTLPNGKTKEVAEYIGRYYICQLSETEIKRHKLYYFALTLCSSATVIGFGFLNNPGSRIAYVALPYVSLFLPMVYMIIGTIGFIGSGMKLEQAVYDKTKIRIRRSIIWQIALSFLSGIGNVVFTLLKGSADTLLKNWIFTGGMLLVFVINIVFLQLQKRVTYGVEDPNYNG
jgi:hypothetical protein